MKIGIPKERRPGEKRVAASPETVKKFVGLGCTVTVETGAGLAADIPDSDYQAVGATIAADPATTLQDADLVLKVQRPMTAAEGNDELKLLKRGAILVAGLAALQQRDQVKAYAEAGITAFAMELMPRITRAQSMDVLSSQANLAGYKAVLIAASHLQKFFPMLTTAAGTIRPSQVLVIGAGVAGLQAIATARRLGAVVTGYDIRPEAEGEITSLGATFLKLGAGPDGAGQGGYARALTPEEQRAQQEELARHIARHDVVITTARVPGRRPPLLVTEAAIKGMRAGSVVVDMAASELGGNVEGSRPGETIVTDEGVTVIGAAELAATMPSAASTAYASNVRALLAHLVRDGALAIDLDDPIQAGVVITHAGEVVHPAFGGES